MYNVNIKKNTALQLGDGTGKSWPDFNIMLVDINSLIWVEMVASNLLKLDLFKETIEEDFEKDHHVSILFADLLDPLDINLVGDFFKSVFHLRNFTVQPQSINIAP